MALFSNKKPEKVDVPVNPVIAMRSQGLDNNQIIQNLQREGYSSSQIFEAMNQADMAPAASDVSVGQLEEVPAPGQPMQSAQPFPEPGNDTVVNQPVNPQQQPPGQAFSYEKHNAHDSKESFRQPVQSLDLPKFDDRRVEVEELVESVIEEKWNVLVNDINTIIEWKNKVETKINALQQDFNHLKQDFDKLHQAVIGKIGEYDKNILNVGAEVKAMEKVFSKVLPMFTENVGELSRVAEVLRKKSK